MNVSDPDDPPARRADVDAILVRSLPFDDPDRVMYVGERDVVNGHVAAAVNPRSFESKRMAKRMS